MRLDNHKLTTVKYKSAFLTRNGKKQQFLTVDEGIRRAKHVKQVKPQKHGST